MSFSKVLIANRGEIACRVIRTCRALGIRSVAVYSDADRRAMHVALADEAVHIGPSAARESYLRGERIIEAARRTGAEAIHPGYGFLSENAEFAEACAAAGIVFIGPPPSAIRAMGGKSESKALMAEAGIPLVPGYHGEDQSPDLLRREAERIGWPVLIKASAGGGGKGMRAVERAEDFDAALAGAKREAAASFGDDRVLIERYVTRPRHVEIQVFADTHGNAVHLFERDCSIQRRHQKVVEEAPAPGLPPETRARMGAAAVAAAQAIGYVGAGTVEFLLDADGSFYFMEMNTRLQVEHPVTELITGQDLVAWQIAVAGGAPLPLGQEDLSIRGHAIEVRLYAEDPDRDFLPATGTLHHLAFPETDGRTVRVDTGVRSGDAISIHYDPMIAKLIVWGEDRATAVRRLSAALADTRIAGLTTNRDFLGRIAAHPAFRAAELDTGFIGRHAAELLPSVGAADPETVALAALFVVLDRAAVARERAAGSADPYSPWNRCDGWRLNDTGRDVVRLRQGETELAVEVTYLRDGYRIAVPGGTVEAGGSLQADGRLDARIDGRRLVATAHRSGDAVTLILPDRTWRFGLVDPLAAAGQEGQGGTRIASPMPGRVTAVLVKAGESVRRGQGLVVLEAMKMEHTLTAPADGVVEAVPYSAGDQVPEGTELVSFKAAS